MHRDMLIIVHPHFGCFSKARMPLKEGMRQLKRGQEWASENPLAERILREHNGRDMVYMREALQARGRRDIVFLLDHDCFRMYRWDELIELRHSMGPELAARVVDEVEGIKNGLVSWFIQNFGDGYLLDIHHRNTGPYLRRTFDFSCNMRITLIGEYLGCCVEEVRHSLSVMSFTNVHVDEEKCVA